MIKTVRDKEDRGTRRKEGWGGGRADEEGRMRRNRDARAHLKILTVDRHRYLISSSHSLSHLSYFTLSFTTLLLLSLSLYLLFALMQIYTFTHHLTFSSYGFENFGQLWGYGAGAWYTSGYPIWQTATLFLFLTEQIINFNYYYRKAVQYIFNICNYHFPRAF